MPLAPNRRLLIATVLLVSATATAGPAIVPGDLALRHDIQRLADYGIIRSPVSTWPLAWGPVLEDLRSFRRQNELPPDVLDALVRVKTRGEWESNVGGLRLRVRAAAADGSAPIRSFQATPREEGELAAGIGWIGNRFSIDLNLAIVDQAADDDHLRPDGSQVAVALGNWTLAASTLDRWWGPGWDSSLVLSNNARPMPAITLDRRFTEAFESRWLRWIGTWDLAVMAGFLEKERVVPDTRFIGARLNFRPLSSLEIGISRTAMWCGDGRPCDLDTFWELLIGRDNRGDDDVTVANEPGNQTAALDFRWHMASFGLPLAVYGQFMAEDEAGGFPSRYIGQLGLEGSGYAMDRWSYRWYVEATSTSCDFWKSDEIFNCAYNHFIYESGYRYKGRTIGHAADNDARVATVGFLLVSPGEHSWQGYLRTGRLNRGGTADPANTLTPLPQDVLSIELIHNRVLRYGRVEIGVGFDDFGGNGSIAGSNDARAFLQWRSDY